jgi:hypothetical protein
VLSIEPVEEGRARAAHMQVASRRWRKAHAHLWRVEEAAGEVRWRRGERTGGRRQGSPLCRWPRRAWPTTD